MWRANILCYKIILLLVYQSFGKSFKERNIHLWSQSNNNRERILGDLGRGKYTPPEEKNAQFWHTLAQHELKTRLNGARPNYERARNIIFFLGDGMSPTTVTAARIRKGQLRGQTGEEESLRFERFPWVGLSKTYCSNSQVADSACSATAYLCGVKANIMTIGVTANVEYNNCSMSMDPKNQVSSIAAWAQRAGKSTGFITTTSLTHASPSGLYAHTANRFWECDADVANAQQNPNTCMDMAQQLIRLAPGRHLDVMMGGGMGKFVPNSLYDAHGQKGERQDGHHLLELWKLMHPTGAIIFNRLELLNLDLRKADKIMGLFSSKLMDFHNHADQQKQPDLAEMTRVAVKFLLRKNKKGFVLFVGSGLIDIANHFNKPGLSISETLELEKAVDVAYNLTHPKDTLIVVTSDHAHPLSISGYPSRGTPILGINHNDFDRNGKRYATLNYALGPEQYRDSEGKSLDLANILHDLDATYPSQIPAQIGVHGGDDVAIYASGPFAHLFAGVIQQHSIPHIMAHAAGLNKNFK